MRFGSIPGSTGPSQDTVHTHLETHSFRLSRESRISHVFLGFFFESWEEPGEPRGTSGRACDGHVAPAESRLEPKTLELVFLSHQGSRWYLS